METVIFNGEEFFVERDVYTQKSNNKKYIYKWGVLHPYWMKNSNYLEKIGKNLDKLIEYNLENNLQYIDPSYKLTKYSKARLEFLKTSKIDLYRELGFKGKLASHLIEIDEKVNEYIKKHKKNLEEKMGVHDFPKEKDMREWTQRKFKVKIILDQFIFNEFIYK